ncbi:MAG: von Willebrand factor type A domain-containing protein, partial [Thermoanaerobaculia bacterium]
DSLRQNVAVAPPPPPKAAPSSASRGAERGRAAIGGVVGGVVSSSVSPQNAPGARTQGVESFAGARKTPSLKDEGSLLAPRKKVAPNGEPYPDVYGQDYGTNPFVETEDDAFSTFGLDVDTGSFTIARRYLEEGHLPPSRLVRPEEFINYFDYDDAPPREGDFALYADGAPAPFARHERSYLLRLGIAARTVDASRRKPAVLTFVVDVSGSMARENRLELVKSALSMLVGHLEESDRLGLVVFGSDARILLEPTGDHDAILHAIRGLYPEGSTNAEEGLRLGYELESRFARPNATNRVILCSDGVANVGHTSAQSILRVIGRRAKEGIQLTTVGFGMGNYNDVLMEQLADHGNGRYHYVDSIDEASRVFTENLTGLLQSIATGAKAQVEFNPKVVARYRLIGYENRDIADVDFRNDAVDAGEIGAGTHVTALYEIVVKPEFDKAESIGALRIRYRSMNDGEPKELGRWIRWSDFAASWNRADHDLRTAALAGAFAEALKQSWAAGELDRNRLFSEIHELARRSDEPKLLDLDRMATMAASQLRMAAGGDAEPLRVGGDVKAPLRVWHVDPERTREAIRAHVEGTVVVEALIDRTGRVQRTKVLQSLPFGLDQKAVDAVRQWRFRPATLHGKPVPVLINLSVHFGDQPVTR